MVIDVLLLIFAGWGFYQGYSRGIIKTVFTVFSIIFGLMAAFKLAPGTARMLESSFKLEHTFSFPVGFLLAFILTMIIIRLAAQFLEKALQTANINFINQIAGGVLLASLYTLVYSLLLWFGEKSHIVTAETTSKSYTYTYLEEFPGKMKSVYEYVKPSFQEFWQESVRFMDDLEKRSMEQTESKPDIFDIPDEEAPDGG